MRAGRDALLAILTDPDEGRLARLSAGNVAVLAVARRHADGVTLWLALNSVILDLHPEVRAPGKCHWEPQCDRNGCTWPYTADVKDITLQTQAMSEPANE